MQPERSRHAGDHPHPGIVASLTDAAGGLFHAGSSAITCRAR